MQQKELEIKQGDLDLKKLDAMTTRVTLADVPPLGAEILAGKVRGRIVVDVNA